MRRLESGEWTCIGQKHISSERKAHVHSCFLLKIWMKALAGQFKLVVIWFLILFTWQSMSRQQMTVGNMCLWHTTHMHSPSPLPTYNSPQHCGHRSIQACTFTQTMNINTHQYTHSQRTGRSFQIINKVCRKIIRWLKVSIPPLSPSHARTHTFIHHKTNSEWESVLFWATENCGFLPKMTTCWQQDLQLQSLLWELQHN